MTLIQIAIVAIIVVALVFFEQIAWLYVLSTFSVTALLAVVAFANFGEARTETQSAPFDDAAAIGDESRNANNKNAFDDAANSKRASVRR